MGGAEQQDLGAVGLPWSLISAPPHPSSSGRQAARLFSVPHMVQQETTLAYLESQVAAALTLRSSHEYRHWLLLYVRYLVNEGELPGGPSVLPGPTQSPSQRDPPEGPSVRAQVQQPGLCPPSRLPVVAPWGPALLLPSQ